MMLERQTIPIREVYAGMYDGPHATPKPSESGPIFLGIKNVGESGQLDLSYVRHISEEEYPRWIKRVKLRYGDIVFSYEATLNRYAMIPKGFRGCLGRRMALIRPDESKACGKFLYYYFFGQEWRNVIAQNTLIGSTVDRIPIAKLPDFPITVPPLPTQRKIAAILSAYDDLIENNLRRIKMLEEMAQNLYREWFVKFRFPGHQHARLTDSPLGRIPEGWEVVSLGKITELRKDKFKEKLHSECPLLDLAKMQQRTLSVGETGSPDELTTSRIIFEEDDILFGSIRPYLHKVALAPYRGVTNVSVLVIRPAEKSLQSFLAVLLSSIDTIRWADQHSTGTKMPVIKWEALQTMPVLMPTRAVLRAFETSVQPMLQTVKMTSSRNQTLRHTRDLLLPRLISGEVDVSELEITISEEAAI